jgi:hypothetical protein
MNGWVLKKLSKIVFDGFADDVKDIKDIGFDTPFLSSHTRSL